jgi:beta-galactosidase/beta-glucuronidase
MSPTRIVGSMATIDSGMSPATDEGKVPKMILDQVSSAPNPQFTRQPLHDLTGTWSFAFDDEDSGLRERWYEPGKSLDRSIQVPYPFESELSGIHDTGYHPVCWYKRSFVDPRSSSDEQVLLRFGAVDYRATVWVDGHFVGEHEGGSTPFGFDVSDALDSDRDEHEITVRVFDDPTNIEQPRGKQMWFDTPRIIFYHRTTGIWQPVWLETVPETRITDIHWTFDRARWLVEYEVTLNRPGAEGTTISVEIEHEEGVLARATASVAGYQVRGSIDLRSAGTFGYLLDLLWSPQRPTLLGTRVTLESPEARPDEVLGYIGLRTVETDESRVLINGSPTYLRMVLSQGYWPESHLAAPSPDAIRREVELILELGFNGARLHQKVEDPRFLYWADRLGLLLWGEIGAAYAYSDAAIDRHLREWREAVTRDRNHPSIIGWVPFNESWGVDDVAGDPRQRHAVMAAYHVAHQLDGTRPVIGNDGWENVIGDILTAHDYSWDTSHLDYRYGSNVTPEEVADRYRAGHRTLTVGDYGTVRKPIILSEFGGVSYAPDAGEDWFGYGKVRDNDEFVDTYRKLVEAVSSSTLLAGFCYTQLTDTLQETNGLLTEDRKPKADIETLRNITSGTGKR